MKKLLYSVSTTLLLLSCSTEDPSLEAEPGKGGNVITFVGRTFPETRTEIGVKDGNSYPVLWSSGDRIGIISPVETLFQNASATLNASDAGKNSGIFVLETETAVESSMDLIVYYPYSSYTTYGDGALHASVPMEQRQTCPGDSSHTGKYTLAYDKTTIDPADAAPGKSPSASFSLRHAVAYVRLVISSTEYAGYKLNGASLWCDGEAVSGDISVNVATGETRTETPRNYATVVVEEPQALSSAQELWLVTLPVNLTGKEVYVSVAMTDGTKNVTIPVKVDVKELKANAVNTITVANVSPADNRFAWYQPEETRYLAEGWAYGEANTFVTSTDGEEITVDIRARGFFNGCEEPKYAKIIFANNLSGTNYTLAINGKRNNPDSPADYAEEVEIGSDYKLTLKTTKGSYLGWFGKVGLLNAEKKFIWAFTVWYLPGGITGHPYKSGVVMDRYIGDSYAPNYNNWHGVGAYFQWGRPFSFSWGSITYTVASTNVTDLKISATSPGVFFKTDGSSKHNGDWWLGDWTGKRTDRKDDFWGNPNDTAEAGSPANGTKSIFDPCPKGWMVASPAVYKEVLAGKDDAFEKNNSVQSMIYKYDGTNKAYWHFSGLKWASSGGNPNNNQNDILGVWSNSSYHGYEASDHNVYQLYYRTSQGTWNDSGGMRSLRMRRRQNDLQTRKRIREQRKRRRRRAAVRSGRLFETHGGQPPADHHVRGRRDGHQGETGRRVRRQPEETPRVHHGLRRQGAHGQGSGLRSHRQAAAVGLDRGGQPDHLLLLRLPSDRGGQILRKGGEGHADGLRLQGLELRDPLPRRGRDGPRRGHRLRLALQPVERRDEEER